MMAFRDICRGETRRQYGRRKAGAQVSFFLRSSGRKYSWEPVIPDQLYTENVNLGVISDSYCLLSVVIVRAIDCARFISIVKILRED